MLVFVDVDLTLIDKDDVPRPHVPEFFEKLHNLGCRVIVWSAGGQSYAERKIEMLERKLELELKQYINEFVSKGFSVEQDGAFYIDDAEGLLSFQQTKGNPVYKMSPYESAIMFSDNELLKAAEAVAKHLESSTAES